MNRTTLETSTALEVNTHMDSVSRNSRSTIFQGETIAKANGKKLRLTHPPRISQPTKTGESLHCKTRRR